MLTKAVRIYGKFDLRLEEFELPEMGDDEILARLVTDSICMSSYKACVLGPEHKRVPDNVAEEPTIIGHEFCGEIVDVGRKWRHKYAAGEKFTVQVALNLPGDPFTTPGYSFKYIGGDATYILIPNCVMAMDCILPYTGEGYFPGSLSEPMSCISGAFHAMYHTKPLCYVHEMGICEGGRMALMAAAGPMGLGAVDYAIHNPRRPRVLVVTDIDEDRLRRAAEIHTAEEAKKWGVELHYVNTADLDDPQKSLCELAGGKFNDVFVFAPVSSVVELADSVLDYDGCLNFFSGPADAGFSAKLNFFDVHYSAHHIVGTSGGGIEDMREVLDMAGKGLLTPSGMVTHIGGLDCVPETTMNLPNIPGGKKLIYNGISMPLTAIEDFERLGMTDPRFARLHELCRSHGGLWNVEAEKYLTENFREET